MEEGEDATERLPVAVAVHVVLSVLRIVLLNLTVFLSTVTSLLNYLTTFFHVYISFSVTSSWSVRRRLILTLYL